MPLDPTLRVGFVQECRALLQKISSAPQSLPLRHGGELTRCQAELRAGVQALASAANMVGLRDMQNLANVTERVLARLSRGELTISSQLCDSLAAALAKIGQMVEVAPDFSGISYRAELKRLQSFLNRWVSAEELDLSAQADPLMHWQDQAGHGHRVLVVEDNRIVARLLADKLAETGFMEAVVAGTLAETEALLAAPGDPFLAAVLDLNLPDAPHGEVVDLVLAQRIPAIVLTATLDEVNREKVLSKRVADYVVKSGMGDLDYVVNLINRLRRNQSIKVLVVDDSPSLRASIRRLLEVQCYQVLEAGDGEEALEIMAGNHQVQVVITDYQMPHMDGLQLISALRSKFSKRRLVIIGISGTEGGLLSAKFLKSGANDFLVKPFLNEEFYCRVNQNVEFLELINAIHEMSIRDDLTGLYNRRYFLHRAGEIFQKASQADQGLALGMLDLDLFKQINDHYGHPAGDQALKHVASLLTATFGERALVARFGGEEFVVLMEAKQTKGAGAVFDVFRKHLEKGLISAAGHHFTLTVSVGVATGPGASLDDLIRQADQNLYEAKRTGRNRVVGP